jgi:hypothetical protein
MATADTCVMRICGRFQEQNIVNTLHYFIWNQTSDEQSVLAALNALWVLDIQAAWLARHSDAYELIGIKSFRVDGVPKVPGFRPIGAAGLVTGSAVLSFASRVITFYTSSSNYRRRGRLQLSGGESLMFSLDDGSVVSDELDLLDVLGDLLREPLVQGDEEFHLCIPPTDVLPVEDVIATKARVTPGVMRSRRVKNFFIG